MLVFTTFNTSTTAVAVPDMAIAPFPEAIASPLAAVVVALSVVLAVFEAVILVIGESEKPVDGVNSVSDISGLRSPSSVCSDP